MDPSWECYSSSFFIIDDRLLPFHASFIIVFLFIYSFFIVFHHLSSFVDQIPSDSLRFLRFSGHSFPVFPGKTPGGLPPGSRGLPKARRAMVKWINAPRR